MVNYVNVRLIKILASFYGIIIILSFVKRLYLKRFESLFNLFYETILDWLMVILFMILAAAITKKMFEQKVKLMYILLVHFLLSLTIGWVFIFVSQVVRYIFIWAKLIKGSHIVDFKKYFDIYMIFIDVNLRTYFVMLGIIYIYYYIGRMKEFEIQKIKLESQLSSTRLKALASQLHPHFLFNTLNSIHSLIEHNRKLSQDTIVDFSNLLREMIDQEDEILVELQKELSFLNKYLRIMKIRFGEHLKVELNIDPEIENALVPNIILQPIVENAIKHGYSKKHTDLKIAVSIFKTDENLVFIIKNSGEKLKLPFRNIVEKGTGIKNITERLRTLYGDDYEFSIYNSEFGVETKISIPYRIAEFELISRN